MQSNATAAQKETEARLRRALWSDDGVRRVVKLERFSTGHWGYLIETRFAFPKFVIGAMEEDGSASQPLLHCGAEWNALNQWEGLKREDAAKAAEPGGSPEPVRSLTP
jgi:hypothetical protein